MLILVWSMIIGAVYLVLLNSFGVIGYNIQYYSEHIKKVQTSVNILIITIILVYAILAFVLLVYPLSGYFADVWCGRYKAVTISLVLLCVALLLLCGATVIGITKSWKCLDFGPGHSVPFGVLVTLSFIVFVMSLSCYQANIVQHNLYKTVFSVLNFARRNKCPLCHSAFTYCGEFRSLKIDFAKERYGGPFYGGPEGPCPLPISTFSNTNFDFS